MDRALALPSIVLLVTPWLALLGAQEAPRDDRSAESSRFTPGDMAADSPVTFPARGAIPSRYPPDVATTSTPTEKGDFLFTSPCRSLEQIERIQAEMPEGKIERTENDWKHLERTRRALVHGGKLHILGLGDSIVNDTMRSGWVARLRAAYPEASIRATVYVRGGGGCQHYREAGRIEKNVLPLRPDLVLIGGISQRDTESIGVVIRQLRDLLPDVEILLASGVFGKTDPRDAEALSRAHHSGSAEYGRRHPLVRALERGLTQRNRSRAGNP